MTTCEGRSRFGQIEGVNEGRIFDNRLDLSRAGVHAPTQNGISGTQTIGCDSIVLNGAYRDDDRGDVINCSGENLLAPAHTYLFTDARHDLTGFVWNRRLI